MNCTAHPDRQASGICVRCGKFFCGDCLVEIDGRNYCRNCLSELFAEMKEGKKETPNINIHTSSTSACNTTNYNENIYVNYNANTNCNANRNANFHADMRPGYLQYQTRPIASDRSKSTALLLCLFLGYLGAHYFYTRKVGMGILYLFTVGLGGIGWLVDILRIACGSFKDSYGLPLLYNNPIYETHYPQTIGVPISDQPVNGSVPGQSINTPRPDDMRSMNDAGYPPFVTWDSYCRISSGMSYQEVCMLLGQEGIPVTSTDSRVQSYQWNGADNQSYALLSFSNGMLADKEQHGLR